MMSMSIQKTRNCIVKCLNVDEKGKASAHQKRQGQAVQNLFSSFTVHLQLLNMGQTKNKLSEHTVFPG